MHSWDEVIPMFCKFQLENGNFKKFSKNYLEMAKILPITLKLLVIVGHTSQWVLVAKYSLVWEKRPLEIQIDQICETRASALCGFKAISKKVAHDFK